MSSNNFRGRGRGLNPNLSGGPPPSIRLRPPLLPSNSPGTVAPPPPTVSSPSSSPKSPQSSSNEDCNSSGLTGSVEKAITTNPPQIRPGLARPPPINLLAARGRGRARFLTPANPPPPPTSSVPLSPIRKPDLLTEEANKKSRQSVSMTIPERFLVKEDNTPKDLSLENVRIVSDDVDESSETSSLRSSSTCTADNKRKNLPPAPSPAPSSVTSSSQIEEESLKPLYYKGEGGKSIDVTANYLKLKIEPGKGVFEYFVSTNPRIDHRDQMFRLVNQLRDVTGNTKTFDGKKLYLPNKLESDKITKEAIHSETGEKVQITFSFIRECRPGDRPTLQLYNILFNRIMKILKFVEHNRKYYNANTAHSIPAHKLQVWPGYVNVVDSYEGGLLLQCDVSHRVLRTETVRDVLVALGKKGGSVKIEAEKALLGVSVLTRYNNKTYKIDDIDFDNNPKSTFTNERGETLSYMDYYKRQYSIDIKDPNQPLLLHRAKKKSANEQEIVKLICLVPELCMMTGLTDAMKADFKVMKEVGNFTRAPPSTRHDSILKFAKSIAESPEASAQLSGWGLSLSKGTAPLTARILPAETLNFGKGYKEQVSPKADWGRAATTKSVLTPVPLNKWALIFMEKNKGIVQNFCKIMQQQGPKMGIPVSNPRVVSIPNDKTESYLKAMRDVIDPSVQLLLTVVPQLKSDRYAAIKKLAYVESPVASQVINLKTISNEKRLTSVVQKVILQINAKLGGELWSVTTPHKDLMVVGIDVFNDKSRGNIVGVVTSLNDGLSRYFSNVAFQTGGRNIMDCLKICFMEGLIKYYEINRKWPKNIVVFRDGVGDGQIDVVEKHEAQQFLDAFNSVELKSNLTNTTRSTNDQSSSTLSGYQKKLAEILPNNYNPGFNYLVIQKRINTRIYAKKTKTELENPLPGTILDHTVTRMCYKDFFLIPQAVNQGTVTPTHFVVVKDQSELKVNDIQKLAYKLTHMYYNWPGTVRVPAPCQYAHKLVDMVGEHIHKPPSPGLLDKLYYL